MVGPYPTVHCAIGVVHAGGSLEINKSKLRFKEEFLVPNNSKFGLFLGGISFNILKSSKQSI